MRYELITNNDHRVLTQRVQDKLDQGWVLHGSPTTAFSDAGLFYSQAVTRHEDHGQTKERIRRKYEAQREQRAETGGND